MQGRFVGSLKENFKAIKQEFKGADIFSSEVKFPPGKINNKQFILESQIREKEFRIKTTIHEKNFSTKTNIKKLKIDTNQPSLKSFPLGLRTNIKGYDFIKPVASINTRNLEKSITITKTKEIELSKKSKVFEINVDRFKIKTYDGTNKIRKIPVILEGRRFLSGKELIDLAMKVKSQNKELDFTKYNLKAVFENLSVDFIEDMQYIDDSVQLKIFYKKYSDLESTRKKLVILIEKNGLKSEKIFV